MGNTQTQKTPKKFLAGNIYSNTNVARPPSPLSVNFKWTPCSIKSDFQKLSATNGIPPSNQSQSGAAQYANAPLPPQNIRPRYMINHLEGHRELTRKDELVLNLKTQL